jgi:signal transduction histidine kinase
MDNARFQMAQYVKNMLNEARMEAGKFKLEKRPLAFRELVQESAGCLKELINQRGLTLALKMPESPFFVEADREALSLVVSNLLANAVKYTPRGGQITVHISSYKDPAEQVVFSVEDTGVGIALVDIDSITAGFYRTEEGKSTAEGFGLGLKITNELLSLHGSHLDIFSEKGKGSRFSFGLPAIPAPSQVGAGNDPLQ